MTPPVTVAIVNTSPDTVDLLRMPLERAGFVVVSCFTHDIRDGKTDFEAFMRMHRPSVIAYDIAVPYTNNFRLYEHVRGMPAVQDGSIVLGPKISTASSRPSRTPRARVPPASFAPVIGAL